MKFKVHITVQISPDEGELEEARKIMGEVSKTLKDLNYKPNALFYLLLGATHSITVSPIPAHVLPPLMAHKLANN